MKLFTLLTFLLSWTVLADKLPREDVINIPSIGEGLCVNNAFQSNMVVQRNKPVVIWGWAEPGETVSVSFAEKEVTAKTSQDRSWKVEFPAMKENSEPLKIVIKGKNKEIVLDNVLIGDVWVLGGQSNMEFPISKVEEGDLEIASANFKNIRMLTIPAQNGAEMKQSFPALMEWSSWFSRHFRKGYWDVCSPETIREVSAIGYVFARRLHMATGVPIGIIDASRGGTTVESWTPAITLRKIDTVEVKTLLNEWDQKVADWNAEEDLKNRIKRHHDWIARMKKQGRPIPAHKQKEPADLKPGPAMDQNRPGNNFASMISPISGLNVKGVIFHQGFNNAFRGSAGARMYYQVFAKMIEEWRKTFNDKTLPFGIISLCTAGKAQTRNNYLECMYDAGVFIREAQYKTFLDLYKAGDKNIGFASSYDKRRTWYHPQLKVPVGERISRWALATQYGLNLKWRPAMLKNMEVKNGQIILKMDSRLKTLDNEPIRGFAIAGKDGRFQPANADWLRSGKDKKSKDTSVIVLSSPLVKEPVHFRYAWARNPMTNLNLGEHVDIPLATQRSDSWQLEEIPLDLFEGQDENTNNSKANKGKIIQALKADDLRRRLLEAKTLIEANSKEYESIQEKGAK